MKTTAVSLPVCYLILVTVAFLRDKQVIIKYSISLVIILIKIYLCIKL